MDTIDKLRTRLLVSLHQVRMLGRPVGIEAERLAAAASEQACHAARGLAHEVRCGECGAYGKCDCGRYEQGCC